MRKLDAIEKFMIYWMAVLVLMLAAIPTIKAIQDFQFGSRCGYRVGRENFTSPRFDALDMGGFDEWFDSGYWIDSSFWYQEGYEYGFKKAAKEFWW